MMEDLNEIYQTISSCLVENNIEEIKRMLYKLRLESRTCKHCDNQNGYVGFKGDLCYSCWKETL